MTIETESTHSRSPLMPTIPELQEYPSYWSTALITSVFIACLSSIQYGYHMSELNAPEHLIKQDLLLSDSQIGLITSIFSIGGLISSSFASEISVSYGLRVGFITTSIFYILGSFIEAAAYSYTTMLAGRFFSGVGGGFAIVFVPLYANEVSPVAIRGLLGSMTQVSVNIGILATQLLALRWSDEQNWRLLLWVGVLNGLLALVLSAFMLEESPKWLSMTAHDKVAALAGLCRLRDCDTRTCEREIESWEKERVHSEDRTSETGSKQRISLATYLTQSSYRNSRLIATLTMIGQQFAGINSVIFYGVRILKDSFPEWSVTLNCLISVLNVVITSVASTFIDKAGRKPMLLLSLSLMTFSLLGLSFGILHGDSTATLLSIFTYVGSFAIGCGPIPFLIVSEVSQPEVKDIAQSWATDCNWVSVFIIGSLFPVLNRWIGGYTYLIFAVVCILFGGFTLNFIPETKGKDNYYEVWSGAQRAD
ncbi:hypothetical protein BRETT_003492 [Brettanomyces bruxellensis]|uniref:Major facilitator superfamily (MFS) profile domain-containing protein n=1 Tax=Dekkera bruxellensis TaxID=5007 RepID=A0A871R528_DEKBR|nr:uncharacterized protein BRETT_003492 [Brettanomyces bruxellensis]QOU19345.1 hypothetical protein BRETT_003492 [Brettanomyces bruxellensis]